MGFIGSETRKCSLKLDMTNKPYRGRIAPSPTGLLHLGHAKTFWSAYQRCEEAGGKLIYRDEDIDPHRCKDVFSIAAQEDLHRLGIRWDKGPIKQSERISFYADALKELARGGFVYPCHHSRKVINNHPMTIKSDHEESIFPVALRNPIQPTTHPLSLDTNWRFRVPDADSIGFIDKNLGKQAFDTMKDFGDFLVWRKEGVPAYELAVVVDDAAMGITEVVRGEDLLVSTARQLLLYSALNLNPPSFFHETLVLDECGARLAKRNDSLSLRTLFEQGHDFESLEQLWSSRS